MAVYLDDPEKGSTLDKIDGDFEYLNVPPVITAITCTYSCRAVAVAINDKIRDVLLEMRQREHEPAHDERPGHEEQQPRVALAAAHERRRLGLLVNDAEGGDTDFLYVLLEVVEILLHLHLDRLVNLLAEAADAGKKKREVKCDTATV
jgi:hypothetical protein